MEKYGRKKWRSEALGGKRAGDLRGREQSLLGEGSRLCEGREIGDVRGKE
jgi:hypothetical protein